MSLRVPSGGLALALSRSPSSERLSRATSWNSDAPIQRNRGGLAVGLYRAATPEEDGGWVHLEKGHLLAEGHTINAEGIADREIYIIRGPDGKPTGVRKVAYEAVDRPGYFSTTQNEARMYQQIHDENPEDWSAHLLPYRTNYTNRTSVIIEFDWVDGENVQTYLGSHPRRTNKVLAMVAHQLAWLAEKGYTHGDIKLDNFFRTVDGRVLILDLGFARKQTTLVSARTEKAAFIHIIRTYVSEGIVQKLEAFEAHPLTDFYTMAERLLTSARRASSRRSSKNRSGGKSSSSRWSSTNSSGGRRSSSRRRPRGGAGGA